ncbi:STAS domain-containing protein [Thalassotalea hakodatensis]|uniref:STAS domain-containing protein n=1 Tax=Thalassotalea hakodatensis TaxID=3030492 RepID=UPI002573DC2C|nr:STAS domain-containing protein [Thalassotalea hakodatensis]
MKTLEILPKAHQLVVKGNLTREFITANIERQSTRDLSNNITHINLSQVNAVDTAGLAWLLLMVERAQKADLPLKLVDLPEDLVKLAKLSAVSAFLPVQ